MGENELSSMENHFLWYLSGVIDSIGNISVHVSKDARLNIGYSAQPRIHISRHESVESVFGLIDEYSEEVGAHFYITTVHDSVRLELSNPQYIRRFLEPIVGGFVQQRERVEFYLDEVLPHFEDEPPQDREEFQQMIATIDELREFPNQRGNSKYDTTYFNRRWGRLDSKP